ncbi:MAG: pilus assembly protein PilM, partial [Candidatus Zixiibacteriota bacterium]
LGRTIAILIEDNAVQLAAVRRSLTRTRLIDVTKIYIPSAYSTDETRQAFINAEITAYIREHGRFKTHYILGVAGSDTALRTIHLPPVSRRELSGAIYWEANRQIPFGLDSAYYGYRIIQTSEPNRSDIVPIAVTAAPRAAIDERLALLETAGITINAIHCELEAIGHLLPFLDGFKTDKTYALINITANKTDISFYRGSQLNFIHTCSGGAEILAGSHPEGTGTPGFPGVLATEIQDAFDYYAGLHPDTNVDTAYMYGDLTYSEDLVGGLRDRFGIEFCRFPIAAAPKSKSVFADFEELIPVSLGAVALAISDYRMIDVLPYKMRQAKAAMRLYRYAIPALAIILVLQTGYWMSFKYQAKIEQHQLALLADQIDRFTSSPAYLIYRQIKRRTAYEQAILEMLQSNPTFFHLNLKELSRITPSRITLDHYELLNTDEGYTVFLAGRAIASDPPPEVALAEYIARLERSPFFSEVSLQKHDKRFHQAQFVVDFQIEMKAVI